MATATAPAEKVHIEVEGFQGFGEFHGSNKDCSADAELMARHPLDGSPLDAATLNLWWGEYWNTGHHTSGGATLAHIYWHLTGSAHKLDPSKCRVAKYIGTDKVSLDTLHSEIKAALLQRQTVIVYLGRAYALPYNERGVYGHFIALGGIDSDKGYLVGNGDDVLALGGKGIIPTRWYTWSQLVAAQINGMIALEKVGGTNMAIELSTPGVASYFEQGAQTAYGVSWKCKRNGVQIQSAMRDFYRAYGGTALCGLTFLGLPLGSEEPVAGHPSVVFQRFERGTLIYDPQHSYDNPPGSGPVYLSHLDGDRAPALAEYAARLVEPLRTENALLHQQLVEAQAQAGDPKARALVEAIRAVVVAQ